ncbi:MAG: hypothetical protein KDD56_03265 [Bdellovibrionales bacterium]|nr:hypothetical protein [Bdellovibrionales bacterium]
MTRLSQNINTIFLILFFNILLLSSAKADWVNKVNIKVNPKKTDSFVVKGTVDTNEILSAASLTLRVDNFEQSLNLEDFSQKGNSGNLIYKGSKGVSGIVKAKINTKNGKAIFIGKRLTLGSISIPTLVQLSFDANSSYCSISPIKRKANRKNGAVSRKKRKQSFKYTSSGKSTSCLNQYAPIMSPQGVFKGTSNEVIVTVSVDPSVSPVPASLELYALSKNGKPKGAPVAELNDKGSAPDEIAGDGVYTGSFQFNAKKNTTYIATTTGSLRNSSGGTLSTPGAEIEVVNDKKLTQSFFEKIEETQKKAQEIWSQKKAQYGDTYEARVETARAIRKLKNVEDASVAANNLDIDIIYKFGFEGGLMLSEREGSIPFDHETFSAVINETPIQTSMRSGTNKVFIWDTGYFGDNSESYTLEELFKNIGDFDVSVLRESAANIPSLSNLTAYDTIIMVTHGSVNRRGEVSFQSIEKSTNDNLVKYAEEILAKKITFKSGDADTSLGDGILYVTPRFINGLTGSFSNSIVWGGFCHSNNNDTMSNAFLSKGASDFFGFSKAVDTTYAKERGKALFCSLLAEGNTTREAYQSTSVEDLTGPLGESFNRRSKGERGYGEAGGLAVNENALRPLSVKLLPGEVVSYELDFKKTNKQVFNAFDKAVPCLEFAWNYPGLIGEMTAGHSGSDEVKPNTEVYDEGPKGRFFAFDKDKLGDERHEEVTLKVRSKENQNPLGEITAEVDITCLDAEGVKVTLGKTVLAKGESTTASIDLLGVDEENEEDCDFQYHWDPHPCIEIADSTRSPVSSELITTEKTITVVGSSQCDPGDFFRITGGVMGAGKKEPSGNYTDEVEGEIASDCASCNAEAEPAMLRTLTAAANSCVLRENCCEDGEDNDFDGFTDCDDANCADHPACEDAWKPLTVDSVSYIHTGWPASRQNRYFAAAMALIIPRDEDVAGTTKYCVKIDTNGVPSPYGGFGDDEEHEYERRINDPCEASSSVPDGSCNGWLGNKLAALTVVQLVNLQVSAPANSSECSTLADGTKVCSQAEGEAALNSWFSGWRFKARPWSADNPCQD